MEDIFYYIAFCGTVIMGGGGMVAALIAGVMIVKNYLAKHDLLLPSIVLMSGVANLCVGGTLFWCLVSGVLSSYLTIVILLIFWVPESFMTRHYSKKFISKKVA